jgi:ATP-dependent RNA helicase SUPV3L1/SUV3
LSYKIPELFPDHDKAYILRNSFNSFIEKSLKGNLIEDDMSKKPFSKPFPRREREEKESRKPTKSYGSRRRKAI